MNKPMLIETEAQLKEAAELAGQCLQAIQNYLGSGHHDHAKVRFPRGYIKYVSDHRKRLWFVSETRLMRNVCYAMLTLDVYRWMLSRTDLYGQAASMVMKEAICLSGSVCEALTQRKGHHGLTKDSRFKTRTKRWVELNVMTDDLRKDVDWMWDIRCREHLSNVKVLEWSEYSRSDYERAVQTLDKLIDTFSAFYHSQK